MAIIKRSSAILLLPTVLGLGAVAFSTADAGQGGSQPVRCEIQIKERGNSLTLEGVVVAKAAIQGSYQLHVSKSAGAGNSDITQSGDFTAAADAQTSLGVVTLGGDGGSYDAKLKVTSQGRSYDCSRRVRGVL